jgi:hypothetical protein
LARAEKWRALLEAGPRMLRVVTDRFLGQVEIGQIGRVTYPAFGFQNGFVGVVVGWRERLSARRVEITLWGRADAGGVFAAGSGGDGQRRIGTGEHRNHADY